MGIYVHYAGALTIDDWIMGGFPNNPKLVEGMLGTKIGLDDKAELRQFAIRTLEERGVDVRRATIDDWDAVKSEIAEEQNVNGFKRTPERGLYLESRLLWANLREAVSILFGGERWVQEGNRPNKGALNFFKERVEVGPYRFYFDRRESDGRELFLGHVRGPQGPQSAIAIVEYMVRPRIEFEIKVLRDSVPREYWPDIWEVAQELGLGAMRSQGFGKYTLEGFEEVERPRKLPALMVGLSASSEKAMTMRKKVAALTSV
jgi:hypothetical protein